MGFVDRSSQFPNRVTLAPVDGQANTYDMTPAEGEVYQEGTPLDAENLTTEVQNAVADALNGVTVDAAGNLIAPNIQAGKGSCPIKKANTNYSVTVQFPVPFTIAPYVVVTPTADAPNSTEWCISSVTQTGFTYRARRTGAWPSAFHWIAIGR